MTRLTQLILGTRSDELHIATFSKDEKFGFLIELGEYHRPQVSSSPAFDSVTAATAAAQELIDWCVVEVDCARRASVGHPSNVSG